MIKICRLYTFITSVVFISFFLYLPSYSSASFKQETLKNEENSKALKDQQIIIQAEDSSFKIEDKKIYNDIEKIEKLQEINMETVQVKESKDVNQMIKALQQDDEVKIVEANKVRTLNSVVSNDPYFKYQSSLLLSNIPEVWSFLDGTKEQITVGVIDSGIMKEHEDLQGQFVEGYNFLEGSDNVYDLNGHGTAVSGIITAKSNNGVGIAGISGNQDVKIMPLQVAYEDGSIYTTDIVAAINYAIQHHVDILNLSFSGPSYSVAENAAIQKAIQSGIILVAAAGNSGSFKNEYPSSYPGVISVGAVNGSKVRSSFSNYGSTLDLVAPGEDILTTDSKGWYSKWSGTSFSSPHVAAIISLMKAAKPELKLADINTLIRQTSLDLGAVGRDNYYGYGLIQANKAIAASIDVTAPTWPQEAMITLSEIGENSLTIQWPSADDNLGINSFQIYQDDKLIKTVSGTTNQLMLSNLLPGHSYHYRVEAGDLAGNWTKGPSITAKTSGKYVDRISGINRFETATAISKSEWETADTVLLAKGYDFPDALAGVPLAYKLDAPILLTYQDKLPEETVGELKRLQTKNVIILGGKGAISTEVEGKIKNLGIKTERIAGIDRFETAAKIAERLGGNPEKAIIAYGYDFPDALAISSYAASKGYPIFLTQSDSLPETTKHALKGVKETIVVGGSKVINNSVEAQLLHPTRIDGIDRFETATSIIKKLNISTDKVYVATGDNFADALTGSILAAKNNAPILLVQNESIPKATKEMIEEFEISNFTILGGKGAVSEELFK